MEEPIGEHIESWEGGQAGEGYAGLRDLESGEFTGVITAGSTRAYMLNGRIIGVSGGTLESFEDRSLTAHEGPHPSVVLLFAMQETGGDTRAQYYTNDTPLHEVDETLSEGGFTGYVELSENVLSGDYYLVYYGGQSLSAAFVGNQEELLTGEEAFERANDEVGIYEVTDVDIEVYDIPEPTSPDEEAAATEGPAATPSESSGEESEEEPATTEPAIETAESEAPAHESASAMQESSAPPATTGTEAEDHPTVPDAGPETPEPSAKAPSAGEDATGDDPSADDVTAPGADAGGDASPEEDHSASDDTATGGETTATAHGDQAAMSADEPATDVTAGPPGEEPVADDTPETPPEPSAADAGGETAADGSEVSSDSAPATDPAAGESGTGGDTDDTGRISGHHGAGGPSAGGPATEASAASASGSTARMESGGDEAATATPTVDEQAWREATVVPSIDPDNSTTGDGSGATDWATQRESTGTQSSTGGTSTKDQTTERIEKLETTVESLREDRSDLQTELAEVRDERDELADTVAQLEAENEQLTEQISTLEDQIAELEAAEPAAAVQGETETTTDADIDPDTALSQTDLFVRYKSKGQATLADVHDGTISSADLTDNLNLDVHTQFDSSSVTVDGTAFETFLTDRIEYKFVDWLVRHLPFEIRDTNSRADMRDVYEAIPDIDRAEFNGSIELDGETTVSYDVIVRSKRGDPLVLARINDARDPATGDMIVDLYEDTATISKFNQTVAASMMVTASFFDPSALETVEEATGGSLLGRSGKQSYVKESRKRGYHLCLVEARDDQLHMTVPDL